MSYHQIRAAKTQHLLLAIDYLFWLCFSSSSSSCFSHLLQQPPSLQYKTVRTTKFKGYTWVLHNRGQHVGGACKLRAELTSMWRQAVLRVFSSRFSRRLSVRGSIAILPHDFESLHPLLLQGQGAIRDGLKGTIGK